MAVAPRGPHSASAPGRSASSGRPRTPLRRPRPLLIVVTLLSAPLSGVEARTPVASHVPATTHWGLFPPGTPIALPAPDDGPRRVLDSRAQAPPTIQVDRIRRTITLTAEATGSAFRTSTGPDQRYHALVSRSGDAMGKALMVTNANDGHIAEALRGLGADDSGGVPMSAWNRRAIPFVPGPGSRVAGTRVDVLITWEGADRSYTLGELMGQTEAGAVEIRFGGNEEHDHHWPSGCIICLYSCPGGVLSNALKTIREHSRGHSFTPSDTFPPDGTLLTVTLQVLPA